MNFLLLRLTHGLVTLSIVTLRGTLQLYLKRQINRLLEHIFIIKKHAPTGDNFTTFMLAKLVL